MAFGNEHFKMGECKMQHQIVCFICVVHFLIKKKVFFVFPAVNNLT